METNRRPSPARVRPSFAGRRGTSLVEVTAVISLSTVAAAVAVGLIGTLLRVDRTGRRHLEAMAGLVRLAEQFRRDVATAENAALEEAAEKRPAGLRLSSGGGRSIEYVVEGGRVVRRERLGETTVAYEEFVLPEESTARFQLESVATGTYASVALLRVTENAPGLARREWRAEARVARDSRLGQFADGASQRGNTP